MDVATMAIQGRRRIWGLGGHVPSFGMQRAGGYGRFAGFGDDVSIDEPVDSGDVGASTWANIGSFIGNAANGFINGGSVGGGKPALMPGGPGSPGLVPGMQPSRAATAAPSSGMSGGTIAGLAVLALGLGYILTRK